MTTVPATPIETLEKAYMVAKEAGLNYAYLGNVPGHPAENTYCPNCNELLIKRYSFEITRWNLTKGMQCPVCSHQIPIKGNLHPAGASFPYALF
jgi:pyruvate formate lyase activating enzyme